MSTLKIKDELRAVLVKVGRSQELMELTKSKTLIEAMNKAVRFTLLHDKDSIIEALKGEQQ